MGEEIEGLGLDGMGLETRIREAQKQVDRLATSRPVGRGIHFTAGRNLSKTTSSNDIPDLLKHHQDGLGLDYPGLAEVSRLPADTDDGAEPSARLGAPRRRFVRSR